LSESELAQQVRMADDWNRRYRLGAVLRLRLKPGVTKTAITASEADVIFGQAVVKLKGHEACIAVSQLHHYLQIELDK
jgi:hypothetical protein